MHVRVGRQAWSWTVHRLACSKRGSMLCTNNPGSVCSEIYPFNSLRVRTAVGLGSESGLVYQGLVYQGLVYQGLVLVLGLASELGVRVRC